MGVRLPAHYRRFALRADGCEGPLGAGYVALWSVGDLAELNAGYAVGEFAPGLLLIGSDGGGTAFALDLKLEGAPVVTLPFVPMDRREIESVQATIGELLLAIEAGRI